MITKFPISYTLNEKRLSHDLQIFSCKSKFLKPFLLDFSNAIIFSAASLIHRWYKTLRSATTVVNFITSTRVLKASEIGQVAPRLLLNTAECQTDKTELKVTLRIRSPVSVRTEIPHSEQCRNLKSQLII